MTKQDSTKLGSSHIKTTYYPCREIILSSGRKYHYEYDSRGGLRRITLPLGNTMTFQLQPGTNGLNRLTMEVPGLSMVTYWTGHGQLAYKRQSNSIAYVVRRDGLGRPVRTGSGGFVTDIAYDSDGRLARVDHEQINQFTMSERYI